MFENSAFNSETGPSFNLITSGLFQHVCPKPTLSPLKNVSASSCIKYSLRIRRLQKKRGCFFFPLVQVWIPLLTQQIIPRGPGSTGRRPLDNRHVLPPSKGHRMHCPQVHQQPRGHRHTPRPTGVKGRAQLWPGRPPSSSLCNQTFPLWAAELVPFCAGFHGVIRFYWHVLTFKASVWKDIWACKCRSTGKSLAQGPLGSFIKTQMLLLL